MNTSAIFEILETINKKSELQAEKAQHFLQKKNFLKKTPIVDKSNPLQTQATSAIEKNNKKGLPSKSAAMFGLYEVKKSPKKHINTCI